jgi:hypothetical protein
LQAREARRSREASNGFTLAFEFAPETAAVPEPATWAFLLTGFAGLGYAGYRRARELRAA